MTSRRGETFLLIAEPVFIVLAAVSVLWWAFTRDLTETQKASVSGPLILTRIWEHVLITTTVTAIVLVVAVPLGIVLTRPWAKVLAPIAIGIANIGQAAPAIGLIVLLYLATNQAGFWIGVLPVALYSLLPVLRNTIVGLRSVDPALIDAARGQGMPPTKVLGLVELPLAVPFILAGLRTTLVLAVGTATLSFLVDAGGLGIFIETGYKLQDHVTLVMGSVLAVCLALGIDWLGALAERFLAPKGLR